MAQNSTVQLNIATANTSKATKEVKSLKEQIRDLKNEMAGLTKGTEEYEAAATQLGDLMHKQAEITESAKMATQDYGQVLTNITSISAGVVGSISAMNGVMNLIGASSDEAVEAMRKIQSLMAIVQGLSQLDTAEKSFRDLRTRIKNLTKAKQDDTKETIKNTTSTTTNAAATEVDAAAKRKDAAASGAATAANTTLAASFNKLKVAMKSFMASNPFTLLILGATTLFTIISSIVAKTKEAAEEAAKMSFEAATRSLAEMGETLNDMSGTLSNALKKNVARGTLEDARAVSSRSMKELKEDMEKFEKDIEEAQANLDSAKIYKGEDSEDAKKYYNDLLNIQQLYYITSMDYYDQYIENQKAAIKIKEDMMKKASGSEKELYEKQLNQQKEVLKNLEANYDSSALYYFEALRTKTVDAQKAAENARKKAAEDAKKAADERRARELNDLKTAYERQKLLTNDLYRDQELNAEEYYDRQIAELNDYLEKWTKLRVKHNKELGKRGLTDGLTNEDLLEIERMNSQAVDLERKKTEAIIELRKNLADSQNYRGARAIVNESRYQNAQNALTDQEGLRYAEQQEELFNAWWLKKFMLIEQYNKQEVEKEREHNDELNRLAMERYAEEENVLKENRRGDEEYEVTRFQNEMKALKERLEAKLISEQDYRLKEEELAREHMEKMAEIESGYNTDWQEIEANRIQTLRDIAQQRYDIEKDYYERRLELDEAYISAYQTLSSSIGGILSKVQEQYSEGSRQYEKIQEANIIMDTVSGALSAFMSGVKSGIPAPGNIIYGGVLSALALAEGQLALNNLHSKKLSSGAANAPSVSAYQTVAYETGAELQGEIQDQRVYVTETDISDTLARVSVMEGESTF